jgi:ATP-binding cassette subfamily B protein
LVELLSIEDTVQDPTAPQTLSTPVSGAITFDAVTFHYPQRPNTVALDDVAFHVAAGETVAIVGPSGAGKSTIMQMLLRFYDPEVGGITIDGVNLRDHGAS